MSHEIDLRTLRIKISSLNLTFDHMSLNDVGTIHLPWASIVSSLSNKMSFDIEQTTFDKNTSRLVLTYDLKINRVQQPLLY